MGANNKRIWWASTIAYPPGLACRPGGEAAKHITTIHIYPILLVWHADRERGKQPYTQQPSSWGLARGSSLVARGSWLVAPGPCLFVCVCPCTVFSDFHGSWRPAHSPGCGSHVQRVRDTVADQWMSMQRERLQAVMDKGDLECPPMKNWVCASFVCSLACDLASLRISKHRLGDEARKGEEPQRQNFHGQQGGPFYCGGRTSHHPPRLPR